MRAIFLAGVLLIAVSGCGIDGPAPQASKEPPAPAGSPVAAASRSTDSVADKNTAPRDLAAERLAFHSKLLWNQPSPQVYQGTLATPPECDDAVYNSGDLRLHAWISKTPTDGKRHPAVVYLHGNWVFEPRHWECTLPYREHGYIVMTPMLRGENGNPGNVEMFWGEVDDAVAAGNYVASLPYVDPSRVYIAGHSVGGTLTMLVAMVPSRYSAAAALSGAPDQRKFAREDTPDWKVFDWSDSREFELRSPLEFSSSIRCPLYLFAGDQENWCIADNRELANRAAGFGKNCVFTTVPGDHLISKPEAILRSLELFEQLGNAARKKR
jgi:dipeptidyl aminopeptidase/acylaminoacyl peptidase